MLFQLTLSQLEYFCYDVKPIFDGCIPNRQALWTAICAYEAQREFTPGWEYCRSELLISNEKRSWKYTTTSGTVINISDTRWVESQDLEIVVEIPDNRCYTGRSHWTSIWRAIAGYEYKSWSDMYYSSPKTEAYHQAIAFGITPECDEEPKDSPTRRKGGRRK